MLSIFRLLLVLVSVLLVSSEESNSQESSEVCSVLETKYASNGCLAIPYRKQCLNAFKKLLHFECNLPCTGSFALASNYICQNIDSNCQQVSGICARGEKCCILKPPTTTINTPTTTVSAPQCENPDVQGRRCEDASTCTGSGASVSLEFTCPRNTDVCCSRAPCTPMDQGPVGCLTNTICPDPYFDNSYFCPVEGDVCCLVVPP